MKGKKSYKKEKVRLQQKKKEQEENGKKKKKVNIYTVRNTYFSSYSIKSSTNSY